MWPATPLSIVRNGSYLLVYSENAIDVFDYEKIQWIQTIPLKKVRPLSYDGSLNIATSMDPHILVYMNRKFPIQDELYISDTNCVGQRQMIRKSKKRSIFKVPIEEHRITLRSELLKNPERKSELISAPRDFNHVAHMGPDDGMKQLLHLPTENRRIQQQQQAENNTAASSSANDFRSLQGDPITLGSLASTATNIPLSSPASISRQDTDPVSGMDNLSYDSGSSCSLGSSDNSFISGPNNRDKYSLNWDP